MLLQPQEAKQGPLPRLLASADPLAWTDKFVEINPSSAF